MLFDAFYHLIRFLRPEQSRQYSITRASVLSARNGGQSDSRHRRRRNFSVVRLSIACQLTND